LTEIRLKKGEAVEKALRRLKKRVDAEGPSGKSATTAISRNPARSAAAN